jgi:hypothetical protein
LIDLNHPDYVIQLATGIVGAGFRLGGSLSVAFLTDEKLLTGNRPDRKWGFWIMTDLDRDLRLEDTLEGRRHWFGKLQVERFGEGEILVIHGCDIEELFDFARDSLARPKV